ncbi:choice-of-anchor I family protein [Motiliproteus sediminis]|uniref:choice-of-anchor I family protein n=1 Tax=Motiliproteus sediminis TaxID=1468178 RepID=UPI001AEFE538|nr:choice-of-anchor I family protein [Motiliproteus sediminis]
MPLQTPRIALTIALTACTSLAHAGLSLTLKGQYQEQCGGEESCAEISAYAPTKQRLYVTNGAENQLRILAIDPATGALGEADGIPSAIDLSPYGGGPNSVAVSGEYVAVAVEADNKQQRGQVVIFDLDGSQVTTIKAGALPDMVTFTPDGRYLLVANEGEPSDAYSHDPKGSVTIIDSQYGWSPRTVDFSRFNHRGKGKGSGKLDGDVRVFGPNATPAQDFEPEYIAVSTDSTTAWVSLQENNAMAIIDIAKAEVDAVVSLGFKDHSLARNSFDASDRDNAINLQSWPVLGMYQPDAIASFEHDGKSYILSANEGDARDYDGYSEEARVKDLNLDSSAYPDAATLQQDDQLGRLKTTTSRGDSDGDGDIDQIYSYGARSFSIWNAKVELVYDSGNEFEFQLAGHANNGFDVWNDGRSDDKGPEPESIAVAELGGERYALIGLERSSGLFAYNISDPQTPAVVDYFDLRPQGDISPEGLLFIPRDNNSGWLVTTNEVSNTVSLYELKAE